MKKANYVDEVIISDFEFKQHKEENMIAIPFKYAAVTTLIISCTMQINTAAAAGLSISTKTSMTQGGNFTSSGYVYDPNFTLITVGHVGRNGKLGNVKSATIQGVNTAIKSRNGSLKLDKNIKNKPNETHIEHIKRSMGDMPEKTISMGTASPSEFKKLPQFNGRFVTTGLWMNSSSFCINCNFSFTTGMFIEGEVSNDLETTPNQELQSNPFKGFLDGMPEGECEGECEWGLKATLSAKMSVVNYSLKVKTENSFIHYKNTLSGRSRIKSRPDLNITGELKYNANKKLFEGVITDNRGISGKAMGRYFGPNHKEVAIVYSLGIANPESMQMGIMFGRKNNK